ncbi:MAG: hypothetical protein DRJ15_11070 [Bacteroidetes bacterium]|nr:MAG: hypothetical protein DRJ15_11070 [Bacteroidota bacterium]
MIRKALVFIFIFSAVLFSQAQDVEQIFKDRIEIYFSFEAESIDQVNKLSRMISIDHVNEDMLTHAYANKKDFSHFLETGIKYTLLQHPGTLHNPRMLDKVDVKNITSWDFYPTYDAYIDMMYQFEADYPDLCDVYSIGTTNNGREILVARITDNVGQMEGDPEFLYTSSMHGDETTGYVLMLRLIDYLLTGYGDNPRITNMVDEIDIYINPLANPDGSYYGGNSSIYGAIRGNANGVDLNRNYPDPEDGPHPDGYAWQTETKHFMAFAEQHNFVMSANFHGGTEVLNYPWDTWAHLTADNVWWVTVCREYADTVHVNAPSGYMDGYNNGITNGYQWYSISGGRQDYMNYFQQTREVTLEISEVKLLPASQLPAHWNYNYRSLLNYLEQCLYGVRGRITDSATGEALEAEVYVLEHEQDSSWVYSDPAAGNYHRPIFTGFYDIRYSKSGYYSQTFDNVHVQNWETVVIDVELVDAFSDVSEYDQEAFQIYPNPVSGNYLKIKAEKEMGMISIYSLAGELSYQQEAGSRNAFVDVSMLASGTYVVKVEIDGKQLEQKLIKL